MKGYLDLLRNRLIEIFPQVVFQLLWTGVIALMTKDHGAYISSVFFVADVVYLLFKNSIRKLFNGNKHSMRLTGMSTIVASVAVDIPLLITHVPIHIIDIVNGIIGVISIALILCSGSTDDDEDVKKARKETSEKIDKLVEQIRAEWGRQAIPEPTPA